MSGKNKFKKEKTNNYGQITNQKQPKEEKNTEKGYEMKSDFLSLGIIFAVFIGALIGLYYYDQQSNILKTITEQLMKMLG